MLRSVMRISERFILIAFSSIFLGGLATGQISSISDGASQTGLGGIHAIVGTVFGPSGQPVETRVRVRLSIMTGGNRSFNTNDTGNFAFRGLPNGSYTISVENEKDFEPVSQNVDIMVLGGGISQTYTVNLRLKAKAGVTAKPAVVSAEFVGVPEKARAFYDAAIEKSKGGQHQEAIDQLKLAINEHPNFMLAHNEIGVQHLKLGQLESADEAFQKASKISPEAFTPIMNRGIANVMMKRYGEAIPILRKAVKLNDKSAVGHYFLGQALANLGLFVDAEKELRASLTLDKTQMKEARRILAIIYTNRGDKNQAAEQLELYLGATPDASDADKLKEMIRQLRASND